MLEAQTAVRNYVTAMEAYLACVDEEMTVAGDDAPETFKNIMFSRHNVAVAEMEFVANHFNEQIQLYRCSTGTGGGRIGPGFDRNRRNAPKFWPNDHGARCHSER